MRILKICLKNLNSLRGSWEVDLENPAFTSDGIFAVTGPTGAGKTTLFDAVCLALYGQTPRQRGVSANGNEVMSRRSAECMAEVTFSTQEGVFVCSWAQRRARGKRDGKFQPVQHEIFRADTGEILASSLKKTGEQVQKLTGLDFERFTRTVLLAQGGFDAFLKAAKSERAGILEMLTGTELYSKISRYVFARNKQEDEALRDTKTRLDALALLSPEDETNLRQELERGGAEETELEGRHKETSRALEWLAGIKELKDRIAGLEREKTELAREIQAFAPERERLEEGRRAVLLDGDYGQLVQSRSEQEADRKALASGESGLPALTEAAERGKASHEAAEQALAGAGVAAEEAAPLLMEVRLLDQELAGKTKDLLAAREKCGADEKKLNSLEKEKDRLLRKREKARKDLAGAQEELKEMGNAGDLGGVKERSRAWRERIEETEEQRARTDGAQKALASAQEALASAQGVRQTLSGELASAKKALAKEEKAFERLLDGKLLREHRADLEAQRRELGLQQKITALEDERKRLRDGAPCPLCGATDHPWASGNAPELSGLEKSINSLEKLIAKAEKQQEKVDALRASQDQSQIGVSQAEGDEKAAGERAKAAQKALEVCQKALSRLEEASDQARLAFLDALTPFDIFHAEDPEAPLKELLERAAAWESLSAKARELEAGIKKLDEDIVGAEADILARREALSSLRQNAAELQSEETAVRERRYALYGDKDPAEEEARLKRALAEAQRTERRLREEALALARVVDEAENRIESLKERIGRREGNLLTREAAFVGRLGEAGFRDEGAFLSARGIDVKGLEKKSKELDSRAADLESRVLERQKDLDGQLALNLTPEDAGTLQARSNEEERRLGELRQRLPELRVTLSHNEGQKERASALGLEYEGRKKEARRWAELNALIGSAGGQGYSVFAQKLTLDLVVENANRHLRKMSGRYLLTPGAEDLSLNVIDAEQGGEDRPTSNLSGGESFIVSLALALGLSQMSGSRMDSLFLDEGFGSLDEDALSMALEALSEVRREGRIIGVISHVQALKDRIPVQIQVTPRAGGSSTLSGPGVSSRAD